MKTRKDAEDIRDYVAKILEERAAFESVPEVLREAYDLASAEDARGLAKIREDERAAEK